MDMRKYAERILSLPIEQLHTLAEADPEAALLWSERAQLLADIYASGIGLRPDEAEKERLLRQLMRLHRAQHPGNERSR